MARRNPPAATQNGGFRRATPCINEMQCNAAQPTLRRYSLTVTKKRSPRHVEGNAWRSTCPERSGRRSTCADSRGVGARRPRRLGSPQVVSARGADDFSPVVNQGAAQKSALHPAGELQPLERRIALLGFGLGGADHKAFVRVDQRDVGVESRRDVALVGEPEALRWNPAQKLGHAVV